MTGLSTLAATDSTLLTVNKRLAGELRARYDQAQHAADHSVWPSADILSWEAWLTRQYERLLDHGQCDRDLLNAAQERLLWQTIIERHPDTPDLLRPGAAAQNAQASARLCADWQLERHPLATLGGDETACFLAWKREFEQQLARHAQMTRGQLLPLLDEAFATGRLAPPRHLLHAGFDTLSPAQRSLFDTLEAAGCSVEALAGTHQAAQCSRRVANDVEGEILQAAAWADAQTRDDPGRRIAVVTPQLTALRGAIQRLFTAVLAPHVYRQQSQGQARFNISLGTPLAERALVDAALSLLESLRGDQPLARIGQLLRSPFVGGHDGESGARALLDAALRDDGLPLLSLRRLRYRADQYATGDARHCPRLIAVIDAVLAVQTGLPERDTPNAWAGHLQRLLSAFGWPGAAPLDSHEYQQQERLLRTFSELATLGKVRARMRLGEAVQALRGIAQETLFQPQSPPAPIQVLGPLEAAGMPFDAIWLLGMDDRHWPPPPQPDPLLPGTLQRELGMPHASAERELAFAATLTDGLRAATPELIASHALRDGDRELRPSPLIADWPLDDAVAAPGDTLAATAATEAMPHVDATPATPDQPGGAGLLGAQAACPFQAVARFRLRATPLGEASHSVDAALTGSLVHALLQRVWQALGDAQGLAAHDEAQLRALVTPLAGEVLDDIGRRRPDLFTPRFRALEADRLSALVVDWLAVERDRTQGFRVEALERRQAVEIGGLTLNTRADRVDRLDDGTLAVVDYKTGRIVSNDGWFDERLSEPQLPLYGLVAETPVSATLLARVRNDAQGCRFVGLARDTDFAPGVLAAEDGAGLDWSQTQAHWRHALEALAREVATGRADPTPSREVCEYCPLAALCRLSELDAEAGND